MTEQASETCTSINRCVHQGSMPTSSCQCQCCPSGCRTWQTFCLRLKSRCISVQVGKLFPCAQDHPVLNRPCYVLHPCQTATLLQLLLPSLHGGLPGDGTACDADTSPTQPVDLAHEAKYQTSAEEDREDPVQRHHRGAATPPVASASAASWQLRYMLAWWSLVGHLVRLALPASTCT